MSRKVRVALHGTNRYVTIDKDSTEGSQVGRNLMWPDGSIVQESEIRGTGSSTTTTSTGGVSSTIGLTLWSLILNIPDFIKSLASLAGVGLVTKTAGDTATVREIAATDERIEITDGDGQAGNPTVGLGPHPTMKNSVEAGESPIIRDGHQLFAYEEFTFDGGSIQIDGDLVVLGESDDAIYDYDSLLLPSGGDLLLPTGGTLLLPGDGYTAYNYFQNLIVESDKGNGIYLGDEDAFDWGWRDITAPIELRGTGANDPTFTRNLGGGPFAAYSFALNDEAWLFLHVPHDIVVPSGGATVHFHVHWKCGGTDVANNVKWEFTFSHAKGFGQEAMNMTGTTVTAEEASAGQWYPMVTETTGQTISNLTEPDGIIELYVRRITNGATDVTDPIYVTLVDVHYQSHNLATKNKAPNFYT